MASASRQATACVGDVTLAAFVEGYSDPSEHAWIEEHLADCDDCRAVFARIAEWSRSDVKLSRDRTEESETEAAELAPGTQVGRYVVDRLVGRGAMGAVYAARDPDLVRTVAVKLLRAESLSESARAQMRTRLLREAQAMARLSHPEVITVYDVGAFGEQLFVAMEYVEGVTLRAWRAERHRSPSDIIDVYERAGCGLAAAHEAGLVHRDFKPDNVLVGRDGRVRVTDFGLARGMGLLARSPAADGEWLEAGAEQSLVTTLTRTGTLLGTPAYMSPEQLRGGAADARSDVFSYCAAFYESLYGERPFAGSSVPELRAAIEGGRVRAAPLIPRAPRWLRAVLLRGLQADPERRFASMRALLDALRASRAASRRAAGAWALVPLIVLAGSALVYASGLRDRAPPPVDASGAMASERRPAGGGPVPGPATAGTMPLSVAVPAPSEAPLAQVPRATSEAETATVRPLRDGRSPAPPEPGRNLKAVAPASGQAQRASTAPSVASARATDAPPAASSVTPLVGNNGALILE